MLYIIFTYLKKTVGAVRHSFTQTKWLLRELSSKMLGISPPSGIRARGVMRKMAHATPHLTTPCPINRVLPGTGMAGTCMETHHAALTLAPKPTWRTYTATWYTHVYTNKTKEILPGLGYLCRCASCSGCPSVLFLLLVAVPSHTPPTWMLNHSERLTTLLKLFS